MSNESRQGFIPVELMQRNINPRIPMSGAGTIEFPPDEQFKDPSGQPRRIAWLKNGEHVSILTGGLYNRPGQPVMFRVATDLLTHASQEHFRQQVELVMAEWRAAVEARIAKVEQQLNFLRVGRGPGRPPKESPSPAPSEEKAEK